MNLLLLLEPGILGALAASIMNCEDLEVAPELSTGAGENLD